jgi:hypothetical protein
MPQRLYRQEPLSPEERTSYEEDLISFCDRELDLLGDIEGLTVLYAGGSSLLWLEGLSQRIGEKVILTASYRGMSSAPLSLRAPSTSFTRLGYFTSSTSVRSLQETRSRPSPPSSGSAGGL